MQHGIIRSFSGSWNSGIGFLAIEDINTGIIEQVPCDNGPTVRALESAFGDVIGGAHSVDTDGGHVNQEIFWDYDDMGLVLGGFTPADTMGGDEWN